MTDSTDTSYDVDADIQANTQTQPNRAHLQLSIEGFISMYIEG